MQPTKPTFGFEYWLTEVVLAGEEIKHTTYTQADIQKLRAFIWCISTASAPHTSQGIKSATVSLKCFK